MLGEDEVQALPSKSYMHMTLTLTNEAASLTNLSGRVTFEMCSMVFAQ